MKVLFEKSGLMCNIMLEGLTIEQGREIQEVANAILFSKLEELDPLIHVPVSEAKSIVERIKNGTSKSTDSPVNKINDIKYVCSLSGCLLKEAKEFVERHFTYPSSDIRMPVKKDEPK
jgi:ribosomal protein L7/L12